MRRVSAAQRAAREAEKVSCPAGLFVSAVMLYFSQTHLDNSGLKYERKIVMVDEKTTNYIITSILNFIGGLFFLLAAVFQEQTAPKLGNIENPAAKQGRTSIHGMTAMYRALCEAKPRLPKVGAFRVRPASARSNGCLYFLKQKYPSY